MPECSHSAVLTMQEQFKQSLRKTYDRLSNNGHDQSLADEYIDDILALNSITEAFTRAVARPDDLQQFLVACKPITEKWHQRKLDHILLTAIE